MSTSSASSGRVRHRACASPSSIWGTYRRECTSAPRARLRVSPAQSPTFTRTSQGHLPDAVFALTLGGRGRFQQGIARRWRRGGKAVIRLYRTRKTMAMLPFLIVAVLILAADGAAGKAAAGTSATSSGGSPLIGKLEGPEIITDPAKFPQTFKEAPQLAALVKAGKLPPVKERIGDEPLVVKPLHEIGKYGGTWRRGFSGPADFWNGFRCCGHHHILFWDYTGNGVVPNLAKGWEVTDGGRTITIFLRKGMKWSDGHPFTADDFVFWYEDMYLNEELVPTKTAVMSINGKPGVVEKVDDFTVRFKFQDPYYVFLDVLAGSTDLGGHSYAGGDLKTMGGVAPKHYLTQFHPKYVGKEAVDKMVKTGGHDNWVSLFK